MIYYDRKGNKKMTLMEEEIIKNFRDAFFNISNRPIVLYGVGIKTKLILDNFPQYNFVGLMDRKLEGEIYGLPIIKEEEAIEKAYCVIIVCTISSVDTVYQRIQKWTTENNIPVYDLSGRKLIARNRSEKAKRLICDISKYRKMIEKAEVISFDIFDTLIMRSTLYPQDIYDVMENKLNLQSEGTVYKEFARNRRIAEQNLAKQGIYTLRSIYEEYVQISGISREKIEYLEQLELQIEIENILPRRDVVNLLDYAKKLGKEVILVSDMYMSREQIERILKKCSIDVDLIDDIYISCDYSMSKYDGILWKYISEKYIDRNIAHFGDNEISDGQRAMVYGIKYAPIYSSLKIALELAGDTWMKYEDNLYCRCIMGKYISRVYNSPFCIGESSVVTLGLEDIGYGFFGPLIYYFMEYLYKMATEKNQKIVFLARDSWLLKNIADKYYFEFGVENVYFLTSRRALSMTILCNNEDIDYIFDIFAHSSQRSYESFCKVIFDIDIDETDIYAKKNMQDLSKEEVLKYVKKRYSEKIIAKSKKQREFFDKYIKELGLKIDDKLAFINFVGSGTTQSFFEKIGFKENSEYYYFATTPLTVKTKSELMMTSVYGSGSYYKKSNVVASSVMFGECVFTSPQSQFMGFDCNGKYQFAGDGINSAYGEISKLHKGIDDYMAEIKKSNINIVDIPIEFISMVYGYLFDKELFVIADKDREAFYMSDIITSDKICNICS